MKNMDSAKKMKITYSKLALAVALFAIASHANAAATLIAAAVLTVATYATAGAVAAIAVGIVATAVVAKSFMTSMQPGGGSGADGGSYGSGSSPNPGNRQQVPPATDNKLPIVYGSAWVGGIVTDLSISTNNQELYYVISLCEVTNNGADTLVLGNMYWGGKRVLFKGSGYSYTRIGTVTSISGTTVTFDNISLYPADGASFTFVGSDSATTYTVASSNQTDATITFTASVSGVSNGQGGFIKTYDPNYASKVYGLLDESTNVVDYTVGGKMEVFYYTNGSNAPSNSSRSAINVMQTSGLVYQWNSTKLMTNTVFAIVHITYDSNAGLTGLQQTKFNVINYSRYQPGSCIYDYLKSTVYGAAIPTSQIDIGSLVALNTYSDQQFTYTDAQGHTTTQNRFKFDGVIDTKRSIMDNLQDMASCCDCLIRYNEIQSLWGVIVQSPTYAIAMALDDSNMVSSIQITPLDIAGTYNVIECKFPDSGNQDSFNSATFDLAQIDPALLFPNEPVNKESVSLPLVNNSVRAQYIANRLLKGSREDLQVQVQINYSGIQLEAGDIVTITNANYGWVAKEFRVMKVTENFAGDGSITANLMLIEFNAAIYDDVSITEFQPAPNTGIGSPLGFGILYAPTITNQQIYAPIPSFDVQVTAASSGVVQYAEVYYSAYSSPLPSQRIFAGTTAVNPNGNPYQPNLSMGVVTITNIPQGNWYFAVKYVNSLGSSDFSASSAVLNWHPMTLQFSKRWLGIAYADNATGTSGFSYNPRNKAYFGLYNNDTANAGINPALYSWYPAAENFSTGNYLLYANRQNRKFSFSVGNAGYLNLGGAFVPTETSIYDSSFWSGLIDPVTGVQSFIDLDARTGQTVVAGATGNNQNDGFLSVTNNTDGSMKVNLQRYLNFGAGVYTKSFTAATLTIDVYGRVVGFTQEDQFYYTETVFNATAGQTSFSFTHTVGWILVFRDGVLLDPSEYTETSTTVVMNTACAVDEKVVCIYMRGVSTDEYYEPMNIQIASSTTNTITYSGAPWNSIVVGDVLSFSNTGTPTTYTVSAINDVTKVVTFTTSISGATAGLNVYRYRAAGSNYAPFTRYDVDVSAITSLTPTTWSVNNGFESIYINGSQISEIDYNITGDSIDGFPSSVTGRFTVIMYAPNNLSVPASNIANTVAYSTAGQTTYPFTSNPLSMEVYANGALLTKGAGYDYTASANNYILATAYNNNSTLLNQQTFARMGAA